MHIGIEVRKQDVILLMVTGTRQALVPARQLKLSLDNDSTEEALDFWKSFEMFVAENSISKISLVEGGSDSSKIRTILEFLIKVTCKNKAIEINTYASSALKKAREKFEKESGQNFKEYYAQFEKNVYTENAFIVAWRFS